MRRGELWWADLAEPRGSEPAKRRPVVIVQEDALTRSRLGTVMVAPITSNLRRAAAPGNVPLARAQSGLRVDGVILACQVLTLDKVFLTEPVGALGPSLMKRLDAGLRLVLALGAP